MSKRLSWPVLAASAVAFGLVGIGFGTAEALTATAIPPNTIHGCVAGTARSLQHVYTDPTKGTTCPSGEQQVVFPKGPDSDQAPQPVTAGPGGLDTVTVQASAPWPHHCFSQGSICDPGASVSCPPDHPYVLGGGGAVVGYTLGGSWPISTGWQVVYYGPDVQNPIDVWAICAK